MSAPFGLVLRVVLEGFYARFSVTMDLESGIIGVAGLACIEAVLASESWG
jgi:hypothetical protein